MGPKEVCSIALRLKGFKTFYYPCHVGTLQQYACDLFRDLKLNKHCVGLSRPYRMSETLYMKQKKE